MIRSRDVFAYVACSGPQGVGTIRFYRLDSASGALEFVHQSAEMRNPSFLVVHPNKRTLYVVNEMPEFAGQPTGALSAYAIDPETWQLSLLNQQPSMGEGPCYVGLDGTGRYAQVANFGAGSVAIYPLRADGSLGPASDVAQHPTLGDKVPRAHSVLMDPTNRLAVVCDLGLDRVYLYRVDLEHGRLLANEQPYVQLAAGAGPRHSAFHPNGKWLYIINELDNTLTVLDYDAAQCRMTELQTISTLPADFVGTSYCADVHISRDGRYLYGSNRAHNTIVCMAIDQTHGTLEPVAWEPCQGDFPRNFALDPSGRFLFSATHNTNNIVGFAIDRGTGRLAPSGFNLQVTVPLCIKFVTA
jgi:6-phosphogluconolactonase